MQENVTALNLSISEEVSAELKEFFEQQASMGNTGPSAGHKANYQLITYND
ncbi:hypothetical protein [Enterobacter roggenkampii]|uniref:hypothetical protein n=1 Tax=Enterobacter roggenkampii TaxID=1812935 RepID=UPI0012FF7240|nr:hypothetical protein [Enterobacter roggenkampii]QWZ75353.1 hypothetical protein I6L60_22920 [Enterobacter roggenkampii]